MEKAYKSLEVGEIAQIGDETYNPRSNMWEKLNTSYVICISNNPVRREINVIEIPAISEGFRELTPTKIPGILSRWYDIGRKDFLKNWDTTG